MNANPFFVPVVYEHAAQLIGKRPWDVSRDVDLLVAAHATAHRLYHHSPVVVGIDVYNVEAEAYGSILGDAGDTAIPSVERNACADVGEILDLAQPDATRDARLPMILEAARRLTDRCTGSEVVIPLNGPFSIASNLVGFEELLMAVMGEPDLVKAALEHLVAHQLAIVHAAHQVGVHAIFFESAATPPLLSPAMFRSVVLPALRTLSAGVLRSTGAGLQLVIGGNTAPILPELLDVQPSMLICPSETDRQQFMEGMRPHPEALVRINMQPGVFTPVGSSGAFTEADAAFDLTSGRDRVCIGTGVLPYEADPDVVLAVKSYLEEKRR